MTGLRAVSFDIWATLARGNPVYKAGRAELVAAALGADPAATRRALDAADDELDAETVHGGRQFGPADRVLRTSARLGVPPLEDGPAAALERRLNAAFGADPPTLTEPDLPATLDLLRAAGLRLAVTSNTGFVPGTLMRGALAALGLRFDGYVFSDEVGHAKPSPVIFERVAADLGLPPAAVLHVGDNRDTDVDGAAAAGLRALWYRPGEPTGGDVLGRLADLPAVLTG